jgi:KEOPS complex subunit Pcc1
MDDIEPILKYRDMKGCVDLVFHTEDAVQIFRALSPELDDELQRSKTRLTFDEDSIRLSVKGEDFVSIRAALNTWIRLVRIAFEMASI